MSELAEQAVDIQIALAKATGFAFAGRLVVAGADADPGGEAIGATKAPHVGADLDQQHGGADQIDAWNGLQHISNSLASHRRRLSIRTLRLKWRLGIY